MHRRIAGRLTGRVTKWIVLAFWIVALGVFAVFYGLDWIATVPPTVKLANEAFGDRDGPIIFGWIATFIRFLSATVAQAQSEIAG